MSKSKKILIGILIAVLGVVVILNTIMTVILWNAVNSQVQEIPVYENRLIKIDDVGYIRRDMVVPDPDKIEEKGYPEIYDLDELTQREAEAARNYKSKAAD